MGSSNAGLQRSWLPSRYVVKSGMELRTNYLGNSIKSLLSYDAFYYGFDGCVLPQRRPSNLQLSLELDGGEPGAEEAGPWGLLKKDRQAPSWSQHMKWRLTWLSRKLLVKPGNPKYVRCPISISVLAY